MSTFTLARLHSVQQDNPSIVCRSELRCDRDPGLPVLPGEQIACEWILTPETVIAVTRARRPATICRTRAVPTLARRFASAR
ncbi:hypothetical protein ABZ136_28620, partial [Streptomyces microflavus]